MDMPLVGQSSLSISSVDEAAQVILSTTSQGTTGSGSDHIIDSHVQSAAKGQPREVDEIVPHEETHSPMTNAVNKSCESVKRSSIVPRVPHILSPKQQGSNHTRTQKLIDRVELKAQRDRRSLTCYTSRNITYFVALFSIVLCLCTAISVYMDGMTHDLQKIYFLANSQVHFLGGADLIGVVVALFFVALFGRHAHKPLLIFFGAIICSCGSFIYALPHFIDKITYDAAQIEDSFRSDSAFTSVEQQLSTTATASSQGNLFLTTEWTGTIWYNAKQYTDNESVFRSTNAGN